MTTLYNIELVIPETERKYVPEKLFQKSVEQIRSQGLLGEKHVNHYGKLCKGFDDSCLVIKNGEMNLFYRRGNETIGEMISTARIKASGFDEDMQEAIGLAEDAEEILGKIDPLATAMPWRQYSELPSIESRELQTACGRQSVHFHCDNGDYIRLWRPKKERNWYDLDVIINNTVEAVLRERFVPPFDTLCEKQNQNIYQRLANLVKEMEHDLKEIKYKKEEELCDKLLRNPDQIEKIPFWLKLLWK